MDVAKVVLALAIGFMGPSVSIAQSGAWKFRARESYELTRAVRSQQRFAGLSSQITYGLEKPFDSSWSFFFNPGLGKFREQDGLAQAVLGSSIQVYQIGTDVKYFPLEGTKGFLRNTLFYSLVDTGAARRTRHGLGLSLSAGWEFWLFDTFSLAPELGFKHTELDVDESLSTVFVSVGIHFYDI